MTKVGFLLLSPLDHDSRVKKEMNSLENLGFKLMAVSVNSNGRFSQGNGFFSISHQARRLLLPGVSGLILYWRFITCVLLNLFNIQVVHCNDLNTLPVGVLLKILSLGRIKVVYDAHEFESNQVPNQGWLSIKTLQLLEGGLIRFADAVITVSEGIAREYSRLYAVEKPALVLNCPPYQIVKKRDLFREQFGIASDATIFLYQGSVSSGRGIERVLEAFAIIDDPRMVVVIMGYGSLVGLVESYAARRANIFYHPAVPPEVVLEYTASADCGLCLIEDSCFSYQYCLPNKLFEYVMAELPVLVSNLKELKTLVNDKGIGGVVEDVTCDGLVRAVCGFKDMDRLSLRSNLQQAAKQYCWEAQSQVIQGLYMRVLEK